MVSIENHYRIKFRDPYIWRRYQRHTFYSTSEYPIVYNRVYVRAVIYQKETKYNKERNTQSSRRENGPIATWGICVRYFVLEEITWLIT